MQPRQLCGTPAAEDLRGSPTARPRQLLQRTLEAPLAKNYAGGAAAAIATVAFATVGSKCRRKHRKIRSRSRRLPRRAMANDDRHHPSAKRNRGPILEALRQELPEDGAGFVLEIASGSGCHAEHFASALPKLQWQPTEFVPRDQPTRAAVLQEIDIVGAKALPNVLPALPLDASAPWEEWPPEVRTKAGHFTMVYMSNVTHISPWKVTCGVLAGAGQALAKGGRLVIYGPFKVDGKCTTQSNADFDERLRSQDPEWGYRDIADIAAEAEKHGVKFLQRQEMPANNFILTFEKQ
ncbi:Mettl26 [Symbiodinium natans]|uniref:Mettl26 protein n=1 Tax=Symbiodinium natans TaxID=878477 RepID=A0A812PJX3_9DINO|nr:Mettl26 [Symbiodinium natans]